MKKITFILLAMTSCVCLTHAADWRTAIVPGSWEEKGPAAAKSYDGVAWYRTWVKVDDAFFTPHERNLYEESVSINIRDLADAHELYANGIKICAGGL